MTLVNIQILASNQVVRGLNYSGRAIFLNGFGCSSLQMEDQCVVDGYRQPNYRGTNFQPVKSFKPLTTGCRGIPGCPKNREIEVNLSTPFDSSV